MRNFKELVFITLPTLIVFALVLEAVTRFAIPASEKPIGFFDEKEKIYRFDPKFPSGVVTSGPFAENPRVWKINNYGWANGRDYQKERSDTYRIAVIGDSFIEGLAVNVGQRYFEIMQKNLGPKYQVYSFGISGAPLSQYIHMSRYVSRNFDPDTFIINVVYNDFAESLYKHNKGDKYWLLLKVDHGSIKEKSPAPDTSFVQYSWTKRNLRNLAIFRYTVFNLHVLDIRTMFERRNFINSNSYSVYSPDVDLNVFSSDRDDLDEAVRYAVQTIAKENVGKRVMFVLDAPRGDIYRGKLVDGRVAIIQRILERHVREAGLELVNLTGPMTDDWRANHRRFNSNDDGHWNAYGHRVVAKTVLEAFKRAPTAAADSRQRSAR